MPRTAIVQTRRAFELPLSKEAQAELRDAKPAVYVLIGALGILYVGQANGQTGVLGRLVSHARSRKERPNHRREPTRLVVLLLRCSCALDHVERRCIAVLHPLLNWSRPVARGRVHAPGRWCLPCMRRPR